MKPWALKTREEEAREWAPLPSRSFKHWWLWFAAIAIGAGVFFAIILRDSAPERPCLDWDCETFTVPTMISVDPLIMVSVPQTNCYCAVFAPESANGQR